MSADTSIAIARFPDGRRHTGVIQAIENMEIQRYTTREEWVEAINEYSWSKPFSNEPDCYKHASHYMDDWVKDNGYPLEYGIVNVGEFMFCLDDTEYIEFMVRNRNIPERTSNIKVSVPMYLRDIWYKGDGHTKYDVDECQECGRISTDHLNDLFNFWYLLSNNENETVQPIIGGTN